MNEFLSMYWPFLVGGLIVLAALFLILRRRGQHVELGVIDPVIAPTLARSISVDPARAPADVALPDEINVPDASGAPDDLRLIKGLGPKVAARLNELGIVRFDQLKALDVDAQAALDAQLGPFAGRMARDRWIEQATLLANDDLATYETQFGKLG
jgi:predicted flap endonuclease-1-like 5' DNA nuclease